MADENLSDSESPASSFQNQCTDGDIMVKQGEFKKAIEAYTRVFFYMKLFHILIQALNHRTNEKNVLISRAKCYLALGDAERSLDDANLALQEDSEFIKVLVINILTINY